MSPGNAAGARRVQADAHLTLPRAESPPWSISIEWMQGGDNPDTVTAWSNLAKSHLAAGRPKKAIPLLERTVAGCERLLARTTGTP
jgi:hypothetical protein